MKKTIVSMIAAVSLLACPFSAMADVPSNITKPVQMTVTTNSSTINGIQVQRIYGADRYQTATAVADQVAVKFGIDYSQGQKFQAVVLASGNNWPDAICGTPLAKKENAPILLLDANPNTAGSQITFNYIKQHVSTGGKVFILGGTGVMPYSFTQYLIGMGFSASNIEQIGGADRDETSLMISKMITTNPKLSTIYMVSDQNFYDAITVASSAADDGNVNSASILLVSPNGFTVPGEESYVDAQPYVASEGDISKYAVNFYPRLKQSFAWGGTGEYSNAENFYHNNSGFVTMFLATGENYPDALTGALLASFNQNGFPIILTQQNSLPAESAVTINANTYFSKVQHWGSSIPITPNLIVLGGPGAVSDNVVNQVTQIMNTNGIQG